MELVPGIVDHPALLNQVAAALEFTTDGAYDDKSGAI
jgi:hypothetical protein